MANYYGTIRTNYFHVKDAVKFREFMRGVSAEDEVHVWEEQDTDGNPMFGFGSYGCIVGWFDPASDDDDDEAWDEAYDRFIDGLQSLVADDDAILLMESGYEKLRYVTGSVYVITSTDTEYHDIRAIGIETARNLLHNDTYITKCEY